VRGRVKNVTPVPRERQPKKQRRFAKSLALDPGSRDADLLRSRSRLRRSSPSWPHARSGNAEEGGPPGRSLTPHPSRLVRFALKARSPLRPSLALVRSSLETSRWLVSSLRDRSSPLRERWASCSGRSSQCATVPHPLRHRRARPGDPCREVRVYAPRRRSTTRHGVDGRVKCGHDGGGCAEAARLQARPSRCARSRSP
jgi:hypothetical protein